MNSQQQTPRKSLVTRAKQFAARPWPKKLERFRLRWIEAFPHLPMPIRLSFGAWWLARDDHVSRPIIEGRFETAEFSFVRRFLKPGMTVLDIGAHHGLYTLLSSRQVGARGHVFAFEPSPRERKALLQHTRLNRCRNVRVQALGLGAANRAENLYVVQGTETGCNSLRPPSGAGGTSPVAVKVVTLDHWMGEQQLDCVDFMKLDVEGGELDVLRGAAELFGRRPRPVILVEVQDIRTQPWGYKARDIICYLAEMDYEWFAFSDHGSVVDLDTDSEDYDGNFVACPKESDTVIRSLSSQEPYHCTPG